MKRRASRLGAGLFAAALLLAAFPLFRVVVLGPNPTIDQLQRLLCRSPPGGASSSPD